MICALLRGMTDDEAIREFRVVRMEYTSEKDGTEYEATGLVTIWRYDICLLHNYCSAFYALGGDENA